MCLRGSPGVECGVVGSLVGGTAVEQAGGVRAARGGVGAVVPPQLAPSYLVVLVARQAVLVRDRRPQRGEGLLVRCRLVIWHR